MTLAERINKTVEEFDPWGYRYSDCSVPYFEELLEKNPVVIINGLLDQIDSLNEELEEVYRDRR